MGTRLLHFKHLNSLHYLRGLMALSVAVYHGSVWVLDEHSIYLLFFGRYAVSIFYILSGLTLSHAYSSRLENKSQIIAYLFNRILRLYPLFIVVTMLTFTGLLISDLSQYSIENIVLNITMLFAFFAPSEGIATGVWSIGNELVFYFLLPVFLVMKKRYNWIITLLIVVVSTLYYRFSLDANISIVDQWRVYVSPIIQLRYFATGILIYQCSNVFKIKGLSTMLYLTFLLIVPLIISRVGLINSNLLFGNQNILIHVGLFLLVLGIYNSENQKNKSQYFRLTPRYLNKLGDWSYGIYLIHPLVYYTFFGILSFEKNLLGFLLFLLTTHLFAALSFNYLERPFLKLKMRS